MSIDRDHLNRQVTDSVVILMVIYIENSLSYALGIPSRTEMVILHRWYSRNRPERSPKVGALGSN